MCCPGREYAVADERWDIADPTLVSVLVATLLHSTVLNVLIGYQIAKGDPVRYYWILVHGTIEVFALYVLFPSLFPHRFKDT
jgi:hypothetical protein